MDEIKFRTPLQLMNDAQKEWFATAIISMVLADGNVSQGEVSMLMRSISFVKDPRVSDSLKKFIHHSTPPTLSIFKGWDKEPKNRARMMLDLLDVAIADRDISDTERDQFQQIGKLLGFPPSKVTELIQMGEASIES